MPFYRKARLFGDGAKGYRLQVHAIVWRTTPESEPVETGILETAVKENRNSGWTVTPSFNGLDYPTLKDAIRASMAMG